MKPVLVTLVMGAGLLLAAGQAAPASTPISLTITVWPKGQTASKVSTHTLRCNPLGGTLSTRRSACRKLLRLGPTVFAPVPPDVVCTQIYGGPQVAVVRGRFGSRHIWAKFRRTDGCQIERWNRVAPWLVPAATLPAA